MTPTFHTIILFLLVAISCTAQDTLIVTDQVKFSSVDKYQYFAKGYHGDYGREDIVFSPTHKRIEYCYYLDGARNCFGQTYKILKDSILQMTNSKSWKTDNGTVEWTFKKLEDDHYFIYRAANDFYEFGYASSIIPLKIEGKTTTTLPNRKDTLWFITYPEEAPHSTIRVDFHTEPIAGKIFEYHQIDTEPSNTDNSPIDAVTINHIHHCYSEPLIRINTMACIITKQGEIKNVVQAFGNLSLNCPFTLMDLVFKIRNYKKLKPAIKKGKAVNVRWFIPVNILNPSYPDFQNHPAISDDKKNRKRKRTVGFSRQ